MEVIQKKLSLGVISLVATAMFALGAWLSFNVEYLAAVLFALIGLANVVEEGESVRYSDIVLIPLALGGIYFQSLSSVVFDFAIIFYLIHRFGPDLDKRGIFSLFVVLPLLLLCRLGGIFDETVTVACSWILLFYLAIDWPIKKFSQFSFWHKWYFSVLALSVFIDVNLENYLQSSLVFLALSILARLSNIKVLSSLFAVLAILSTDLITSPYGIFLVCFAWFDVYGAMAMLLFSPLLIKATNYSDIDSIAAFAGLAIFYINVTGATQKPTYKKTGALSLTLALAALLFFLDESLWTEAFNHPENLNWYVLMPAVLLFLSSVLWEKKKIKALQPKACLDDVMYGSWGESKDLPRSERRKEFLAEKMIFLSERSEWLVFSIILGSVFTIGVIWLASTI